jgi:hypothetical protein
MTSAKPSVGYPFVTKRQVIERLGRDPSFVRECIEILHRRYLERDRVNSPAGWMSSHRKLGEELHARLTATDCSDADIARAAALAKRYAKQLTKVLRDEQIARDPRLGLAAAVFGVRPADEADDGDDPYADRGESPEEGDGDDAPPMDHGPGPTTTELDPDSPLAVPPGLAVGDVAMETPPVRRRGRPKGSKNKAKADAPRKTSKRRRGGK